MTPELAEMTTEDVATPGHAGILLRGRCWTVGDPRGVVIVAHGLGEHGGAYRHVAEALGRLAGVETVAFDFRGHGRSPGRRGVVRAYDDFAGDLRGAVAFAEARRPGLPRFALGHSNGGQVVLRAVLEGGLGVAGLILSNPALRVATAVAGWKLRVGRLLRRVAPVVTLPSDVDLATLTRDLAMIEERRGDPLRHARVSPRLYFGLVEGGEEIARRAPEIILPTLLILGGADPLIDPGFTAEVFDRIGSPDKTRLLYPEMLHEPLNEIDRELPLAAIARWLSDRIAPPTRPAFEKPL